MRMNNTTQTASPSRTPAIGDILASEWGYEQTNVDFYLVTKVTKASVVLAHMVARKVSQGYGQGITTPTSEFVGPRITRRFKTYTNFKGEATYGVKINSYESARPWNGSPVRYTDGY